MNCMNCGASVQSGATHCRKCGTTVEQTAQPPFQPGQPASQPGPVNVIIQMGPGGTVPGVQQPQLVTAAPKSKIVAGILGILLGFLGVHRFYLGYKNIGLIQLLLTLLTCGYGALVTGPWGAIEGIFILVGKIDRDAWGRPLND